MSKIIRNREFTCCDCKRRIVQVIGFEGTPALCAECLAIPGWYEIPAVREVLDPEMEPPR